MLHWFRSAANFDRKRAGHGRRWWPSRSGFAVWVFGLSYVSESTLLVKVGWIVSLSGVGNGSLDM